MVVMLLYKKLMLNHLQLKTSQIIAKAKEAGDFSIQSETHQNPYDIKTDTKQSLFTINNKNGFGFRCYSQITIPGCDQNSENKINQDTPLVHLNVGGINGFNLFGVLDGHGPHGYLVSKFCKEYFIKKAEEFASQCKREFINDPKYIYGKIKKNNFSFIKDCFYKVDSAMMKQNQLEYNKSGTTCNIVFQFLKYLVCASVGDLRGIVIFDDNPIINQGMFQFLIIIDLIYPKNQKEYCPMEEG